VRSKAWRTIAVILLASLFVWAATSGVQAAEDRDPLGVLIDLIAAVLFGWLGIAVTRPTRSSSELDGAGISLGVRRSAPRFAGQPDHQRRVEQFGLAEEEIAHHVLLLGATGSGKTTSLLRLAEGTIARGLAFVAVDLKGSPEVLGRFASIAVRAGRSVYCWSLDGRDRWNPLARGDVSDLKDKLIGMETWSEPHYKRAAERYVQTVFTVLAACGETASLSRVSELMSPAVLNATLRSVPPELAERVGGYLEDVEHSRDQRSAIQGLGSRLALMAESSAGDYLMSAPGERSFDLLTCVLRGEIVIFSLDSLRYGELAAGGRAGDSRHQDRRERVAPGRRAAPGVRRCRRNLGA
jgi:Type IV secretion-system coupling protein DNA-binding domain